MENSATNADDPTDSVDAQPAPAAEDDWPVGRLVETIWAMDAEANGGVDALRRDNRLADWVARARAVHRCGWSAAEPWSPGEREAAAWILDDHDAINRFATTPAEIVTRLGYDIQARSRTEAERHLGTAKAAFTGAHDPMTGTCDIEEEP
ncbi:hypothetical protein ACFTWF_40070 [Rhodococcus sp. NPDC056960]|uniref:hypothetical protein n=1 Tax=Rhodococcus sp. NPDC056960 TaxID=3345982 RepID=UPI003640167D